MPDTNADTNTPPGLPPPARPGIEWHTKGVTCSSCSERKWTDCEIHGSVKTAKGASQVATSAPQAGAPPDVPITGSNLEDDLEARAIKGVLEMGTPPPLPREANVHFQMPVRGPTAPQNGQSGNSLQIRVRNKLADLRLGDESQHQQIADWVAGEILNGKSSTFIADELEDFVGPDNDPATTKSRQWLSEHTSVTTENDGEPQVSNTLAGNSQMFETTPGDTQSRHSGHSSTDHDPNKNVISFQDQPVQLEPLGDGGLYDDLI